MCDEVHSRWLWHGERSEGSIKDFIASDDDEGDEAAGAGDGAAQALVADFLEGARHKQDSELVRRS